VDAGDFAGDPTPQGRMLTDALVEAMNGLDYQVANLSQRELGHGYPAFLEWRKKARFEFVSANIVWQDTGEPVVAPFAVRKVALRAGAKTREIRFGFIGLTRGNPAFLVEGPDGRRIVTMDPLVAVAKQAAALKPKADVIVALVSLDLETSRQVAKRAREIDLMVGGLGGMQTRLDDFPEDTQIGKTRLLYVGDQGKFLGDVRLFFNAQKAIASTQRTLIGLSREWPDEPVLARLMETTKLAINEYNKTRAEAATPFGALAPPQLAAAPPPGAPAGPDAAPAPSYTGSGRCAGCHQEAFAVWQHSGHARAFRALVDAHQDFNPECVGCHTIGFRKPEGFASAAATPHLINVGCESCHGPSGRHPEANPLGFVRSDTAACVTCHTRDNSPDFDPAIYIPKIRHWPERQASR
jgi:hypothetical protein